MTIEWSISVGNIIQIAVIAGGGLLAFAAMKVTVANLKEDVGSLKTEVKNFGSVLVKMADMRGEIRVLDTRVAAAEQDIREIRHGDGFIRGPRGIDREY